MKRIAFGFLLALSIQGAALAQNPGLITNGAVTAGHLTVFVDRFHVQDGGANLGASAITSLTGDVTAAGPGAAAATLATAQPGAHTWAATQTFSVAPVFTDQSGTRTALGLGTFATQNYATPPNIGGTTPAIGYFSSLNVNTTTPSLPNGGLQVNAYWASGAAYIPPGGASAFFSLMVNSLSGQNAGIASLARTSDVVEVQGLTSYVFADKVSASPHSAFGFYIEQHQVTQFGTAGSELAVVERYGTNAVTPFGPSSANGLAAGIQIDCGNAAASTSYTLYSCSHAINIVRNVGAGQGANVGFANGVVFTIGSMDTSINPIAPAISFPSSATYQYALAWYTSQTHVLWNIYANGTNTSNNNSLVLGDSLATFSTPIQMSSFTIPTTGTAPQIDFFTGTGSFIWFADATHTTGQRIGFGSDAITADIFRIYGATFGGNVFAVNTATARTTHYGPVTVATYTVGTLPLGVRGDLAYVTDATACTFTGVLTGGGTVVCPVFYNGSAWIGG